MIFLSKQLGFESSRQLFDLKESIVQAILFKTDGPHLELHHILGFLMGVLHK